MKTELGSRKWLVGGGLAGLLTLVSVVGFQLSSRVNKPANRANSPDELRVAEQKVPKNKPKHTSNPSPRKEVKLSDATTQKSPPTGLIIGAKNGSENPAPINPNQLAMFKPVTYSSGKPHYDGEPVKAFVRVASTGLDVSLSPNQMGEYPRVYLAPRETSRVLLEFPKTSPNTPVAVTAQDGGAIVNGKPSAAPLIDAKGHLVFDFIASENPGIHRVSFATPGGEAKLLDFWVGPELTIRKL